MFIDANVLIHTILGGDRKAIACLKLIEMIEIGKVTGDTSLLVLDEVAWEVIKARGKTAAIDSWQKMLSIPKLNVLSLNENVAFKTPYFMKEYDLEPRDSIHAATCVLNGIKTIVSFDKDFDKVKELERKTPFDF
ncbi:type II toxin-antitoxin system VapC family toxin [Candidatus Micrarchaeota archaeon]|nr:type II toxin-antitoxin system VapC family toxin [Candidatus Micrarchaeota archaeon]